MRAFSFFLCCMMLPTGRGLLLEVDELDVDVGPTVRNAHREELDSVDGLRRLLGHVSTGQSSKPTLGNARIEEDRMHHVIKLHLLQQGKHAGSGDEVWVSSQRLVSRVSVCSSTQRSPPFQNGGVRGKRGVCRVSSIFLTTTS